MNFSSLPSSLTHCNRTPPFQVQYLQTIENYLILPPPAFFKILLQHVFLLSLSVFGLDFSIGHLVALYKHRQMSQFC